MSVVINGSAGVTTNTGAVYNSIQSGTAVASTSGTSIDFTSIPSWVKRITVMFNGVSTNGSSNVVIQIGSGSFTTSGYSGSATNQSGGAISTFGVGFTINPNSAASDSLIGICTIALIGSNTWVQSSVMGLSTATGPSNKFSAGSVAISGTLDRVRVTTTNGTDTFDAGSINILYE